MPETSSSIASPVCSAPMFTVGLSAVPSEVPISSMTGCEMLTCLRLRSPPACSASEGVIIQVDMVDRIAPLAHGEGGEPGSEQGEDDPGGDRRPVAAQEPARHPEPADHHIPPRIRSLAHAP